MRITVLQNHIQWADIDANILSADRMIRGSRHSDIYMLPEMWSTGFATEPQGIAEKAGKEGKALGWMLDAARRYDCAIAGSIAVNDRGTYRNRFYFARPDGSFVQYDKRHLFKYGKEDKFYTPGSQRVVVPFRGVRFMLNTCYDMRFPVWQRNFKEYDVLLVTANWPSSRQTAWDVLLRARAIENQCFVVGCNRVGEDPYSAYAGGSAVIDAYGQTLAASTTQDADIITCELDMDGLRHFRAKFPVLDDADSITIQR